MLEWGAGALPAVFMKLPPIGAAPQKDTGPVGGASLDILSHLGWPMASKGSGSSDCPLGAQRLVLWPGGA